MRRLQILIVEDDRIVARDLREVIDEMGHGVAGVVDDAESALRTFGEQDVDLAILDVRMSGALDGIDLGHRLSRDWGVPIIYVTAFSDQETLERARASRPLNYLIKPVDPRDLRTAIEVATARLQDESRLRGRNRWLESLVDAIPDPLVAANARGRIVLLNPAAQAFTGLDRGDAVGRPIDQMLHFRSEPSGSSVQDPLTRAMEEGGPRSLEEGALLQRPDGSWVPVSGRASEVRNGSDRLLGGVLVLRDARVGRRARESLDRSEERYRAAFQANPLPVHIVSGEEGRILDVNPAFEDRFGYERDDVLGRTVDELELWSRPEERAELLESLGDEARTTGFRTRLRTRSGHVREVELAVERVSLKAMPCLVVVSRDVTEQAAFEEDLERRALYDTLTDLPNRTLFRDRLGHALERARRDGSGVAVLFIDLDRFKEVNDTLGHAAGDEVLRLAGRRIRGAFRDEDTVARMGGDEFAAVLEDVTGPGEAAAAARRVLEALEPPFAIHGTSVRIRASIGIAVPNSSELDAEELLRSGDAAMYRAKKEGGETYRLFDPEDDGEALDFLWRKRRIRSGIQEGEFVLHYQPIVELETGAVVGAEALARWSHPEEGLLRPDDFLPLVQQEGLAPALGRELLASALRGFPDVWSPAAGGPLPFLSMNLMPAHFLHDRVAEDLDRFLSTEGVDRSRLVLEVAEGVAAQSPTTVRALRSLGVGVALDDVGTGHVSLAALKELKVDGIKLDRAFVRGLGREPGAGAAVRAAVAFADTLGLRMVAEGVETGDQVEQLIALGCPLGQGYRLYEPMTGEELAELLG